MSRECTSKNDKRRYGAVMSIRFKRCLASTISSSTLGSTAGNGASITAALALTPRLRCGSDPEEMDASLGRAARGALTQRMSITQFLSMIPAVLKDR